MENNKIIEYLSKSHQHLVTIVKERPSLDSIQSWKNKLLPHLQGTNKIKISRIDIVSFPPSHSYSLSMVINQHEFAIAKAVLMDLGLKHANKNTKESFESLKLLKAREENIDFENELAQMIHGSGEYGDYFPFRAMSAQTKFFQDLGHNFTNTTGTRTSWIQQILEELNVEEIYEVISKGLFRKKYFSTCEKSQENQYVSYENAMKIFKEFITNSITSNESTDLSGILDMNINIELLFDTKANTIDNDLNELIKEAKKRFLNNDKQIGLEKLWDAFERLKTHFISESKDKKESASKLVDIISEKFDKELIHEEFMKLSKIGNNYKIRHHEVGKLELTQEHITYFFYRMLSLIDLCLLFLEEQDCENLDLLRV